MRALNIDGVGQVSLVEIADPSVELADGEVRIAVKHVGLCGSDLATFTGLNPLVSLPRVPGHEIGGEILAVGAEVPAGYGIGRRVIVIPYTACGACSSCRKGRTNACRHNKTLGVQQEGGLKSQLVLHHSKLILNDQLPARHLALVEPLSVGFHAAARGQITETDTVVVLGCGMIGMGAVAACVARGAKIIAVDLGDKANMAAQFGAAHTIDAGTQDVVARVNELTNGHGADVVIEAVGSPHTFAQAIDLACFAGRVVFIGYAKEKVAFETRFFNLKELDIFGSRNATLADFEAVILYLEKLAAAPQTADLADRLISAIFPFDEADKALPFWVENRANVLKIMVAL